MHHYQFNIGDYKKDTAHLSLLEHGIYRVLIDSYYTNEGPLVADDAKLMRTHCVRSADEQQAYKNVIDDFFEVVDGSYKHEGCDKVLAKIYEKSDKARESAAQRWACKNKDLPKAKCANDANGMRTHSERYATHNPLPITHNPIPITHNPIPITHNPIPITHNPIPITDNPIPITYIKPASFDAPGVSKIKFDPGSISFPENLNVPSWLEWCAARKKRKKAITEDAAEKQISMLVEYDQLVQAQIIDQSIANDWTGLFPPKIGGQHHGNQHKRTSGSNSAVGRVWSAIAARSRQREAAVHGEWDEIHVDGVALATDD